MGTDHASGPYAIGASSSFSSAALRHYEHRPAPVLSTAFEATQRPGPQLIGQSPSSATSLATSLSSPFIGHGSGSLTGSPHAISNHTSPVAVQTANIPYDPSHWPAGAAHRPSTVSSRLANSASAATGDSSQGLSPPPPYSPQHPPLRHDTTAPTERPGAPYAATQPSLDGSRRPGVGTSTAQLASASTTRDQRPLTGRTNDVVAPQFPPPPPTDRRARSSSRTRNERTQPLFSLSALASRVRSSSQATTINRPEADYAEGSTSQKVSVANSRRARTVHASAVEGSSAHLSQLAEGVDRPPATRRSCSAGGIGPSTAPAWPRSSRRSSPQAAWEPGMPLPPPPPGPPPPSGARSQSLNRSFGSPSNETLAPQLALAPAPPRRHPGTRSSLSPVPPTPADWLDNDDPQTTLLPRSQPDLGSLDQGCPSGRSMADHIEDARDQESLECLERGERGGTRTAGDGQLPKGIRERRSESRSGRKQLDRESNAAPEPSNNPWADEMDQAHSVIPANLVLTSSGTSLTRRPAVSKSSPRMPLRVQTSDGRQESAPSSTISTSAPSGFSRTSTKPESASQSQSSGSQVLTSPFWPRPGTGETSPALPPKSPATSQRLSLSSVDDRSSNGARPMSRSLYHPNPDASIRPPPSPSRRSHARPPEGQMADAFARAAIGRHQAFAGREAAAANDRERVQLFAEYIVGESRLRRSQYADAIDAMGSEILELTRDLFRPDPSISLPNWNLVGSGHQGSLNSAIYDTTDRADPSRSRPESAWWSGYMPSLSPIPSMSVTEVPDERTSRGRPSSRWWEASQSNSVGGGGTKVLERSKRESKYMGLPLRDWDDGPSSGDSTTGPSALALEYPPEKVGWHEQTTPRSSDPRKLDVSRLVTLPPPYPRHHPAVNNNHPDLAALRTVVRGLSEFNEIVGVKQKFATAHSERELGRKGEQRRRLADVRQLVEKGSMTYAEAAKVEEAETKRAHGAVKVDFDQYQTEVLTPLHALLSERINKATVSFEQLERHLVEHNPVEEGDDKPELLEKLTLLKWLFEAREQLHREVFDLSSERNERYKKVVMAPYTEEDKIIDVKAFFEKDGMERQVRFEKDALDRFERFMDLVEDTVKKGVEVQLSTFWDIAPPLVEVMQRVDVEKGVQTDGEYEFSQQYLWEVLGHAEKSAYQFIEGQTNLLCLLHEVKSGMAKQACKAMEAERLMEGGGGEDMTEAIAEEEDRLTVDLKEKVRTVEKQWDESMGQVVEPLKERVREYLQEHGGWEGCEDD